MRSVLRGLGFLGGGLLGGPLIKAIAGGKKKSPIQPVPGATRDDAAAIAQATEDAIRRRKGSAADILTGSTGAEAALSGGKLVLGS